MDQEHTFEVFFDLIIYYVISWCKLSNLFPSYTYASLLTNWERASSSPHGFKTLISHIHIILSNYHN